MMSAVGATRRPKRIEIKLRDPGI